MNARLLVVDDDESMCELAAEELRLRGHQVAWRLTADEALTLLGQEEFDVVIADIQLGGMTGLELCQRMLELRPDVIVIVMTAFGSLEGAIGAIRAGAYDFVTKPASMEVLGVAIERAIQHRRLKAELKRLEERIEAHKLPNVVGESPAIERLNELVSRVATSDASVLITGESGTGKELVARALHDRSGRKGPFLAINCAAVPETLLESELFGHVRGAFTDAKASNEGLFVRANGGSLFLDEIGEMPQGMQAKILRALQERRVRAIGDSTERSFDARLITATNRDIERDVQNKVFREDLYYRINVVHVEVPPLRDRRNDVLLLAHHFLTRAAARTGKPPIRLGSATAKKLLAYDWPGNVRELENCMERAVALAVYDEITVDDLPAKVRAHQTAAVPGIEDPSELPDMDTVERRYIEHVLNAVKGNKTLSAKILGFDRRTLYRKLAQIGAQGRAPVSDHEPAPATPELEGSSGSGTELDAAN
jgi:DNA-binding NtrC family response regulator